jgi:hypothetical protein
MNPGNTFTLPVINGKTFTRQIVVLDGTRYENCRFDHCTIVYSGGPADLSACAFSPNTIWDFRNNAALVIQTLQLAGFRLEFGAPGPNSEATKIQ